MNVALFKERLMRCSISFFFFFFQAEDGIRDFHVTGVQTCALPICTAANPVPPSRQIVTSTFFRPYRSLNMPRGICRISPPQTKALSSTEIHPVPNRSEERRVGKERSARGSRDEQTKRAGEKNATNE